MILAISLLILPTSFCILVPRIRINLGLTFIHALVLLEHRLKVDIRLIRDQKLLHILMSILEVNWSRCYSRYAIVISWSSLQGVDLSELLWDLFELSQVHSHYNSYNQELEVADNSELIENNTPYLL